MSHSRRRTPSSTHPAYPSRRTVVLGGLASAALAGCGGGGGDAGEEGGGVEVPGPIVEGPPWLGFARDAQHTAASSIASRDLGRIAWSTPVDEAPQYTSSGSLLIHYGSPLVTPRSTVVLPVKTGATQSPRVEARSGSNGALVWSAPTDYAFPAASWVPAYNPVLTNSGRLYAPGAGGKLLMRESADSASGQWQNVVFYGADAYSANPGAFDSTVFINTPLTADAQGNVFFGFVVTGANPAGLVGGGIARVDANGQGRWISAATASQDALLTKAAMNCAPALSPDGSILYVAVNRVSATGTVQRGMLLALDSTTLAVRARAALVDPESGEPSRVSDNATSSPAVGPDGRVFFGVLEPQFGQHNGRGWLLQFDALLQPAGVPGSFGWDVTPTVIPATMVPSYTWPSTYLLALKYNNYGGNAGGDGLNRMAVIDPGTSQTDAYSPVTVMREVLTILAPTADPTVPGGRQEWCINTMAADPGRRSVLANNEDGILYRWDLATNTLSQSLRLTSGRGQAYTPTLVGADGAVYAVSDARLFCVRD